MSDKQLTQNELVQRYEGRCKHWAVVSTIMAGDYETRLSRLEFTLRDGGVDIWDSDDGRGFRPRSIQAPQRVPEEVAAEPIEPVRVMSEPHAAADAEAEKVVEPHKERRPVAPVHPRFPAVPPKRR